MNKICVEGGRALSGEVSIGGSKNAALPILFAGILTGECCEFSNLPRVSDVLRALEILKYMGARILFLKNGNVRVDYSAVRVCTPPAHLCAGIRGSAYLMGAMLGRTGEAFLPSSGGCDFGARPIDQHLLGFERLGALVSEGEQGVHLQSRQPLQGTVIRLKMPSVGATGNLMMAAVLARGETVIENAAAEPHVAALADFLCAAGAQISGVGSHRILVRGVATLHGVRHRIISDMIEAGTYLCIGAACGGRVRVSPVHPEELGALLVAFDEMGIEVCCEGDSIAVQASRGYRPTHVTTAPYPGFPTDLHPQMLALMAAGGRETAWGSVTETVFLSRFRYINELRKMNANVKISDRTAMACGGDLHAARVLAPDLRGGAALLLAALKAKGKSEILGAAAIARGYEHLEQKLRAIGANVSVY